MVNTFLTSPDYKISAKQLDARRLWKQVLEARQILHLIENFHVLGKFFNDRCPSDDYEVYDWTRRIMNEYKKSDSYIFFHQGEYVSYPKSDSKPVKIKYDEDYQVDGDAVIYKDVRYEKYEFMTRYDRLFTMGFWSHPCVVMWMNYSESLRVYINAHIDEFVSRGGKKDVVILKSTIRFDVADPPFVSDPNFIRSHKAALYTKEKVRSEEPWYAHMNDFQDAYLYYSNRVSDIKSTSDFDHYIWPFSHDRDDPLYT